MEKEILLAVSNYFSEHFNTQLSNKQLQLQATRPEFEGDITLVVFPFTSISKKGPEETAKLIGEYLLKQIPQLKSYNAVKGFLNIVYKDEIWVEFLKSITGKSNFGQAEKNTGKLFLVEYSSPNTNKPLHLGHLRNHFVGFSVAEILKAAGNEVKKVQIINDRGIHICKSMLAWQKFGNGETPESSGMKGDKLVGKYYVAFDIAYKNEINDLIANGTSKEEAERIAPIMLEASAMLKKWEAGDANTIALWKKMNAWVYEGFDETYRKISIDFDKNYYESETYILGKDIVDDGLKKGIFEKDKDGSVWIDNTPEGLDRKILLRSDGTSVYMTQDVGTAVLRYKDFPNVSGMIYTVGNEQEYHFKVLFLILKKLGYAWANECHHLSYGMVDLPDGKMKSREGTVVDADDLLAKMLGEAESITNELGKADVLTENERVKLYETLSLGALKYYILKVDPKKKMLFNPKESIDFQGHTGPFIQYAYARIHSLLEKSTTANVLFENNVELLPQEISLLRWIKTFPSVIQEAAHKLSPADIANYTFELVQHFNHFYQTVPVLKEENIQKRNVRLAICNVSGNVIKNGMRMLGINVPNRM